MNNRLLSSRTPPMVTRYAHGMALVSALIITLIVGIVAMAIGRSALTSQQNSAIEFDALSGFALAQSGMNAAERLFRDTLVNDKTRIYSAATNAISTPLDSDAEWWRDPQRWATTARSAQGLTTGTPQFRIEEREFVPLSADMEEQNGRLFFRVSSRGSGQGIATAMQQTYISVMVTKQEEK